MTTPRQFSAPTTYFLQEGRENLRECLKVAFRAAKAQGISKVVIFTAKGEGVRLAIEEFCSQDEFKEIRLVAVTFPAGKTFKGPDGETIVVDISDSDKEMLSRLEIPLIKAHLPFDPIAPLYPQSGGLGQDLSLIGEALNTFCGSMGLCVQAILMACDAGAVNLGEHVISLTSDTAILAQATSTRRVLRELVIREVLCKPVVLSVWRKEIADRVPVQLELPSSERDSSAPADLETRPEPPEAGSPPRPDPEK